MAKKPLIDNRTIKSEIYVLDKEQADTFTKESRVIVKEIEYDLIRDYRKTFGVDFKVTEVNHTYEDGADDTMHLQVQITGYSVSP